ncbi:hypothetical protein PBY51_014984 [Eleginops maclovinus]|uniref:Uncharacterized protein n=1 Tax=Eleginops maclovinus TaxID=56733 RepID=A0AAN7WZD5_ELEMC|nr:hypothetical protein PBY51_014984 [Eleginops maclovinus]
MISKLEKRLQQNIIHADGVEAERNLLLRKQLKEQAQEALFNKKIHQLQEKLRDQNCETNAQSVKLARLRTEMRCLRNQLQKVRKYQKQIDAASVHGFS